jgi:hypothetical protein
LTWDGGGQEWTAVCQGIGEHLELAAEQIGARIVDQTPACLEDIFVAHSCRSLIESAQR